MKSLNLKNGSIIITLFSYLFILSSCDKNEVTLEDPYAGGKEPFGIKLDSELPNPSSGRPGTITTFKAQGLLNWQGQFDFLINNEIAEIQTITDSTITVKVPSLVSSGIASVVIEHQVFYGPKFTVEGNVTVDPNFGLTIGTNGPIFDYIQIGSDYLLVGSFTDIEQTTLKSRDYRYTGMAKINSNGVVYKNRWWENYDSGGNTPGQGLKGLNTSILSISKFSNGKYLISGNFDAQYVGNRDGSGGTEGVDFESGLGSITRLNENLSLQLLKGVTVINPTPEFPERGKDDVPIFNAAFPDQVVIKSIITPDDKVIAVGNLSLHTSVDYSKSTRETRFLKYTPIKSVVKMDEFGAIDPTYHTNSGGINGIINDAELLADGKLIIVGGFNSFDGIAANNIVKLDQNGNYDASFNIGTGANGQITNIEYSAELHKIIITGGFTEFNGASHIGVVILNEDGSIDGTFKAKEFVGGKPTYGKILSDGRIVLSGSFDKYDQVTRSGFLILDPDGSVTQDFNVAGSFEGQINQVVETTSATGKYALMLMGFISRFDDQSVGNIVRIEIEF